MKKMKWILAFSVGCIVLACNDREARYLDLNTGESVELKKEESSGVWVNAETGKPVKVYVDRETNDTIWGSTGKVVNGKVYKTDAGEWKIKTDDEEFKATNGDTKIKAEDGDFKIKDGDYKKKVEKDGDVKIKDGDKTIKIDGETGERKVKND